MTLRKGRMVSLSANWRRGNMLGRALYLIRTPQQGLTMAATGTPRFNVLHIISDQHQAEAAGYEGHRQAITPNLDRLAAEGVRFRNAYTNNPICTPSRVTVLSGRYCHNHGYFGLNGPTPPADLPDFLSHFGKQGYHTAAVGKLHLPNKPHHWLANRVGYHAEYTSDWNPHCEYVQWAASQGFKHEIGFGRIPDIEGRQQNEARPSKFTYRQTVEGFTNEKAMGFISACGNRPWAMQVSYFRPHQCYTPPQEFWDLYDDDLELPQGWNDHDLSHRPPNFAAFAKTWREAEGHYEPRDPESRYRRVWRGSLACISMIGHQRLARWRISTCPRRCGHRACLVQEHPLGQLAVRPLSA